MGIEEEKAQIRETVEDGVSDRPYQEEEEDREVEKKELKDRILSKVRPERAEYYIKRIESLYALRGSWGTEPDLEECTKKNSFYNTRLDQLHDDLQDICEEVPDNETLKALILVLQIVEMRMTQDHELRLHARSARDLIQTRDLINLTETSATALLETDSKLEELRDYVLKNLPKGT